MGLRARVNIYSSGGPDGHTQVQRQGGCDMGKQRRTDMLEERFSDIFGGIGCFYRDNSREGLCNGGRPRESFEE